MKIIISTLSALIKSKYFVPSMGALVQLLFFFLFLGSPNHPFYVFGLIWTATFFIFNVISLISKIKKRKTLK